MYTILGTIITDIIHRQSFFEIRIVIIIMQFKINKQIINIKKINKIK